MFDDKVIKYKIMEIYSQNVELDMNCHCFQKRVHYFEEKKWMNMVNKCEENTKSHLPCVGDMSRHLLSLILYKFLSFFLCLLHMYECTSYSNLILL